jgi:Protein of unknown function (DUF3037)
MTKTRVPYTYCVLRYVHDPAAGEALNVGVLAFAPTEPWLECRIEQRYARLSATFRDFNGHHYRGLMRRTLSAIESLKTRWKNSLPAIDTMPTTVDGVFRLLFPDPGLCFQRGETNGGIARDLELAIADIFDRMVTSQHPDGSDARRTDAQVWSTLQTKLEQLGVLEALQPKTFSSSSFNIQFDYAWKNAEWHVIQPLSMDYRQGDSLQRAATIWLGNATALKEQEELGELAIVLGAPQSSAQRAAYSRAKDLLHKMPITHRLIEEDESEDFANEVAASIREHDLLDGTSQ